MPNTIGEIKEAINKALKTAEEIEDDFSRSLELARIAETLARIGDINRAKETIDKALKTAERIENNSDRSLALARIAETLAEIGDINRAKETIDKALKTAEEIENNSDRSLALARIAKTLARIGDINRAKETIDKALKTAEEIENNSNRSLALARIAETLAEIGDINKALKTAEEIEDDSHRSLVLARIAKTLARIGDINKALKTAEEIEDDSHRSLVLARIAETLAEIGDINRAKETIDKALKTAEEIENNSNRSSALALIATIMKEIPVLSVETTKLVLSEEDYLEIMLNSNVTVENVIVEFEGLDLEPVKIKKLENEQLLRLKPPFKPGKKKLKVKISFDYRDKRLFVEREFNIELKSARETEIPRESVIIADQQRVDVQRKVEEKRFSKYKLIELVGSGAFADVYKAHDESGNIVALKIYRGDDKAFLEEIGNFVQLTKRLNIPYVVKPLDYGSSPKPYVVMEYYPMTLRGLIRRDIELKKKLKFMYRLAKALSYAHPRGIYHGDLKPENILVKEENGEYYPAIADWGGGYTPGYSAPEVVKSGGKILNSKSDVYSLGVILYELLTGQKLFEDPLDYLERGENVKVTLQDKELEDLINASLSKPEHRLNIDEFKNRLGKYLVDVIGTRYSSSLRSRDILEVINMHIDYGDLEKAKSRILIAEKYNLVPGKMVLVSYKIVELMAFLNEYKGRTISVSLLEVKYKGILDLVSQINPDIVKKIKGDKYSLEQFISMNQDIPPALYDEVYLCALRLIDTVFAGLNSSLP